jgi:glycosyltransferase involved in cell wall biosynthesis
MLAELGYEVDVLYISETDDLAEVSKGLDTYCNNIYPFILTKRQSYLKVLTGLLTNLMPLQVNYFYSRKVKRWIRKNASRYDAIYCNNIRTAVYARNLKIKKIVDYVDAYSMNYRAARDNTKGLWHWIYTIDYPRCNRFEQKILHEFDKCLIISDIDREFILSQTKDSVNISVIENFTPIDESKRVAYNAKACTLLFVGAMNYEPNVSAVTYFCKWVLPKLIERYPDIMFYIVGKTPTPDVMVLANDHVVVTGFVESIWDYMKDATLVVTPMQTGSGLQNKILQALAVGACVVTTPKGFEGLVTDEGQPYVAKNSKDMIKTISHLIDHPEERELSGQKSIEYVKRHYDKEVIKEKFAHLLQDL